jgi:allophanate hydrolase
VTETAAEIATANRDGASTPEAAVARAFARVRAHGDAAVFISLRDEADARAEARELRALGPQGRPLFGVPIAVKDNIDVGGLETTAACPTFAYRAKRDAAAVAALRAAGAIVIGKTNLDQFATGLAGVRSPYGIPRNPLDAALIPGGSSSGSAVAVSAGIVPLALGTDTAGSGRVPAMLNNIVGLKPSLGLVSTAGVVPACRTLDSVSVFALTVEDAWLALGQIAGPDARDPYSRVVPLGPLGPMPARPMIGVPMPGQRIFFGDGQAADDYQSALERLMRLGASITEIDIEPFYEAARLLYEGPWVAERYVTARDVIASSPESLHPVTLEIILEGARKSAAEVFTALYRVEELRRIADSVFRAVDALALPTAPTVYTLEQILADPIRLNSRLGTYTNFVNLLDLCGLAVPAALHPSRRPFGLTLLGAKGADASLASIGRAFQRDANLPLGALNRGLPHGDDLPSELAADETALAVVGAHISGMPLNGELRRLGARFREATTTAPNYRLYELAGVEPARPGLLRVATDRGVPIEVEVWALRYDALGHFLSSVPSPLSIGTVTLADGRAVKGFLVEVEGLAGARDISAFGGWRRFVASKTRFA